MEKSQRGTQSDHKILAWYECQTPTINPGPPNFTPASQPKKKKPPNRICAESISSSPTACTKNQCKQSFVFNLAPTIVPSASPLPCSRCLFAFQIFDDCIARGLGDTYICLRSFMGLGRLATCPSLYALLGSVAVDHGLLGKGGICRWSL